MVIASLAKDLKGSMIVIGVMGHIAIQLLLKISQVKRFPVNKFIQV